MSKRRKANKNPPAKRAAPNTQAESQLLSVETQKLKTFSGPIPDPESLDRYKSVDPRSVEWILQSSADERRHRHEMDRLLVGSKISEIKRGQYCALASVVTIMLAAVVLAWFGETIPASIMGVGGLVCIVALFLKKGDQNDDKT